MKYQRKVYHKGRVIVVYRSEETGFLNCYYFDEKYEADINSIEDFMYKCNDPYAESFLVDDDIDLSRLNNVVRDLINKTNSFDILIGLAIDHIDIKDHNGKTIELNGYCVQSKVCVTDHLVGRYPDEDDIDEMFDDYLVAYTITAPSGDELFHTFHQTSHDPGNLFPLVEEFDEHKAKQYLEGYFLNQSKLN